MRDGGLPALLRMLYRRRRPAGAIFLLAFTIAVVHAFAATPVYRATAKLLIEPWDPNVVTFEDVVGERGRPDPGFYAAQGDVLRSRALARTTLDRLGLWAQAESGPGDTTGGMTPEDSNALIEWFLEGREIELFPGSRTVDVHFSSTDPRMAADAVNMLSRVYIEWDDEFRSLSSRDASNWLQQRLMHQRRQLEAREQALQRYREEEGAAVIEDRQHIIVQRLADLDSAARSATRERLARQARYRELLAAKDDPEALDRFPEIVRSTFIQTSKLEIERLRRERARLAEQLGDLHPEMISVTATIRGAEARLRAAVSAVVDSVRIEFEAAETHERQLLAELETQTAEALALDRKGIEYGLLQREAQSSRRIYEALLLRAAETGVAGALEASNVRIVDAAEVPVRPARPRRSFVLLVGFCAGVLFAGGFVFFVERMNDRIEAPEQLRDHLGVQLLGMVPAVGLGEHGAAGRRLPSRGHHVLIGSTAPDDFTEAVRSIRTGLIFSSAAEGCRSVVVTSTAPSEGKSCVAGNLAVSLAQLGLRTLLVDVDLRRPTVHALFGQEIEPGLSDVLAGDAPVDDAVRKTSVPGLSVIPGGRPSSDPTVLLASDRFRKLVESSRTNCDWIVFDAPSVLPVSDALLVAGIANDVVFVIGADSTSRRTAASALEHLSRSGARVVGAVLNKAPLARHPYYYARHYRREYTRHYQRV